MRVLVAGIDPRSDVGVQVAEQDHRQAAVGRPAWGDQLLRLCPAHPAVGDVGVLVRGVARLVVERLEVRVDEPELRGVSHFGIDARPAARHVDRKAPGLHLEQRVEIAAPDVRRLHSASEAGEDGVAHGQPALELTAERRSGRFVSVGVRPNLEVEFGLRDHQAIARPVPVEFVQEQPEEVPGGPNLGRGEV